jgi:Tol biopolymer transport system component
MIRIPALLLAIVLLAPVPATAWHRKTPLVVQVTSHGAGTIMHPGWSGARSIVFFDSDADLIGNGNATRQIFLYDLPEHDRMGTPAIYQLTTGDGDSQRGTAGGHGQTIVYDTRPGGVGPRQIYAVDRVTGTTHAVTQGDADSLNPRADFSGRFVVFESDADLLGSGLSGTQVYRADLGIANPSCPYPCSANGNLGLIRVTNKVGTSRNGVAGKGGKTIVFESDADLLNSGATGTQVYLFDATAGMLTRVSSGPGPSRNPSLPRNGRLVAFESDDAGGDTQVMLYWRSRGTVQPLTSSPGAQSTRPSFEAAGGRTIVFLSTGDLLGTGSIGTQVFRYDVRAGTLTQITNAPGTISDPSYSSVYFVTFLADSDLLRNGNTGVNLFLVNLFKLGPALLP